MSDTENREVRTEWWRKWRERWKDDLHASWNVLAQGFKNSFCPEVYIALCLCVLSLHLFHFHSSNLSRSHYLLISLSFPFTWKKKIISESLQALITLDQGDERALGECTLFVCVWSHWDRCCLCYAHWLSVKINRRCLSSPRWCSFKAFPTLRKRLLVIVHLSLSLHWPQYYFDLSWVM